MSTFTKREFDFLTSKYGSYGGWAIWNKNQQKDTNIINENLDLLNTKYIGIGLNISAPVGEWENFRIGRNDRKLKFAFNHIDAKGFYLTDLIKNEIDVNANSIAHKLKNKNINIDKHITFFQQEMLDLKIDKNSIFLLFGGTVQKIYKDYFQDRFLYNPIIECKHYAMRGTDQTWVEDTWRKMQIQMSFEKIRKQYH